MHFVHFGPFGGSQQFAEFANLAGGGAGSYGSCVEIEGRTRLGREGQTFALVPVERETADARAVFAMNPETDKHPAAVAQCTTEEDVMRCIDFGHQHALEVAVRSGNASFLGWGSCDKGIVIDLFKMKRREVDPVRRTGLVATGCSGAEILTSTAQHGLAPVLGECGNVGAGVALGGGLGWLSGRYGSVSDNLLSARVITADTRILKADSSTNEDLFWAIRGNFGVATQFEYRLHPVSEAVAGILGGLSQ